MLKISQSLVKEIQNPNHCPKQVYYSFVEGKELRPTSEPMLVGRYFESELLGACAGGSKQEPGLNAKGEKYAAYQRADRTIDFARNVFKNIGLEVKKGTSQKYVKTDLLSGNIDHINFDLQDKSKLAIYDVKWTGTKEDDRWNGWADVESKLDAHIQAMHYVYIMFIETGVYMPFYFLIFGEQKDYNWFRAVRIVVTEEALENYKRQLANVATTIKHYHDTNYKGNGNYNKCASCPFASICPDKTSTIEIETIYI